MFFTTQIEKLHKSNVAFIVLLVVSIIIELLVFVRSVIVYVLNATSQLQLQTKQHMCISLKFYNCRKQSCLFDHGTVQELVGCYCDEKIQKCHCLLSATWRTN